jgi:hypothetical protein
MAAAYSLMVATLLAANNAPADWVYGTLAGIAFVLVITVPAAALNSRERKRRQQEAQQQ